MKKATVKRFLVREHYGDLGQIVNARQEISRGKGSYGVNWKFEEVSEETFKRELKADKKSWIYCIETQSGKFIEVDKDDLGKFTNL